MNALFSFDLASTNGHFMVDAGLKSLQAAQISPVMKALARAEFESFTLDDLQYHIEGNDYNGTSDMRLRYHNLKLNVLETDEDGNLQKKGFLSFLANLIKLYPDNPIQGEPERVAKGIKTQRITTKNFFVLVCFGMLNCAQEIVVKGKNKNLPGLTKKPVAKK